MVGQADVATHTNRNESKRQDYERWQDTQRRLDWQYFKRKISLPGQVRLRRNTVCSAVQPLLQREPRYETRKRIGDVITVPALSQFRFE